MIRIYKKFWFRFNPGYLGHIENEINGDFLILWAQQHACNDFDDSVYFEGRYLSVLEWLIEKHNKKDLWSKEFCAEIRKFPVKLVNFLNIHLTFEDEKAVHRLKHAINQDYGKNYIGPAKGFIGGNETANQSMSMLEYSPPDVECSFSPSVSDDTSSFDFGGGDTGGGGAGGDY